MHSNRSILLKRMSERGRGKDFRTRGGSDLLLRGMDGRVALLQ